MDEIRRTIMNEFADETCCDMFIMVLKQKWPEFDGDLKGRCTVEIVKDTNDPRCMSASLTFEHLDDFILISDWAEETIIPFRDSLSPKTQTRRRWRVFVQAQSLVLIYRPVYNLIWQNSGVTSACYSYRVCFEGLCLNGCHDAADRWGAFGAIIGDQVSNSSFSL